jgi:hypothetical protein
MRLPLLLTLTISFTASHLWAGPYAPAAGQPGSTAIANNSQLIVEWANGSQDLIRGPQDIANPGSPPATFGTGGESLGFADGNAAHVVSLGDGGQITLTFANPITNGPGFDFAVFENGFADAFLELAFVEVSSNGSDFLRFPAVSLTQTSTQTGSFGALDPTNLDNLAGKYRAGFGTPFDLAQVAGLSPSVDVDHINFVRILDVVGSINPLFGQQDSLGNLVNDPYPTAFASGGFDLDGVAVMNRVPEPSSIALLATGLAVVASRLRKRRRHINRA